MEITELNYDIICFYVLYYIFVFFACFFCSFTQIARIILFLILINVSFEKPKKDIKQSSKNIIRKKK